jgi:uridylate kinase
MLKNNKKNVIVISLGGSLIMPKEIDAKFIINFKKTIIELIQEGYRFVIVTGGGKVARNYIQAAAEVGDIDAEEKDWLGVHATRMNAHFIKTVFKEYTHPRINKNPRTKEDLKTEFKDSEKIMIAAGWRPGWSTDYVATILAERFDAKKLINLSNITHLYDKDPNASFGAKQIKEISWPKFRKIGGDKWDPGMSAPFDPIASKLAQESGLEVAIIGGDGLENIKKYINGEKFEGSIIS